VIEVFVAFVIVLAGTLIAVRASAFGDQPLGAPDGVAPRAPQDIVPADDEGLGFMTVLEERDPRTGRAMRLGVGLLLVGGALGLLIIAVARGLALVWPRMFPVG
jgi:hypothetical protein